MPKVFKKVMCKDCTYYDDGICRRLPPMVRESGTAWPIVDGMKDWCGKGVSNGPVCSKSHIDTCKEYQGTCKEYQHSCMETH